MPGGPLLSFSSGGPAGHGQVPIGSLITNAPSYNAVERVIRGACVMSEHHVDRLQTAAA